MHLAVQSDTPLLLSDDDDEEEIPNTKLLQPERPKVSYIEEIQYEISFGGRDDLEMGSRLMDNNDKSTLVV